MASEWWPMAQHDAQRTGRTTARGPANPALRWSLRAGSYCFFAPAVDAATGTVYVGAADGFLYAINPDGTRRWSVETGRRVVTAPAIAHNGAVYYGGEDVLVATDARGAERWARGGGNEAWPPRPLIGPNGMVYVGLAQGQVHALHPDGTEWWRFDAGEGLPGLALSGAGRLYCTGDRLHALGWDGGLSWTCQLLGTPLFNPAVAPDGSIFIGTDEQLLHAVDPAGYVRWARRLAADQVGDPAVTAGGGVLLSCANGRLVAYDGAGMVIWTFDVGEHLSTGPVVAPDGTIYVGSDRLYALRPGGEVVWTYSCCLPITGTPAIAPDGTVYVGAEQLYALRPDGQLRWTHRTDAGLGVGSTILLGRDRTIYACLDYCHVYATDAEGTTRWTSPIFHDPHASPYVRLELYDVGQDSLAGSFLLNDDMLCIVSDRLRLLSPTGSSLWEMNWDTICFAVPMTEHSRVAVGYRVASAGGIDLVPIDRDGAIEVKSLSTAPPAGRFLARAENGTLYVAVDGTSIHAISPSGKLLWAHEDASMSYTPVAVDALGLLYIARRKHISLLHRLDSNGNLRWTFEVARGPIMGVALSTDGMVYAATESGTLYALDRTGAVRWAFKAPHRITASPVIDGDGIVYICSTDLLLAIASDGTLKWSWQASGAIIADPAIGGDGTIYLGTMDGFLLAIGDAQDA